MSYELNAQDLFVLDNILRKYKTLPLVATHGFLTACVSAPEQREIDALLPYLFGGQLPPWQPNEADAAKNLITALRNNIEHELAHHLDRFSPLDFLKKAEEVGEDVQKGALKLWCVGYLHGSRLDADFWQKAENQQQQQYFIPMILLGGDEKDFPAELDPETVLSEAADLLNDAVRALYRYTGVV